MVPLDDANLYITYVVASLSFFGSVSLICTYLFLQEAEQQKSASSSRQLIFFLSCTGMSNALYQFTKYFQENRTIVLLPFFNFHFILFLKIFPDCFQSIFFLINYPSMGDGLCKAMAMFGILSAVASFIWTVMISHYIWRIVTSPFGCPSGFPFVYHIVSWGSPVLVLIILLGYSELAFNDATVIFGRDQSVGWCFIKSQYIWPRLLSIYVPLSVSWLLTFYFYFRARERILHISTLQEYSSATIGGLSNSPRIGAHNGATTHSSSERTPLSYSSQQQSAAAASLYEMLYKLALIPLLFVLLRGWGALYRIWWFVVALETDPDRQEPDRSSEFADKHRWLQYFVAFGDSAQGFFNFIIFVLMYDLLTTYCGYLTRAVREKYLLFLRRTLCWRFCSATHLYLCSCACFGRVPPDHDLTEPCLDVHDQNHSELRPSINYGSGSRGTIDPDANTDPLDVSQTPVPTQIASRNTASKAASEARDLVVPRAIKGYRSADFISSAPGR